MASLSSSRSRCHHHHVDCVAAHCIKLKLEFWTVIFWCALQFCLWCFKALLKINNYSDSEVGVIVMTVVKVTVLLSDIADWPKVNTVYQKCMYLVAFYLPAVFVSILTLFTPWHDASMVYDVITCLSVWVYVHLMPVQSSNFLHM